MPMDDLRKLIAAAFNCKLLATFSGTYYVSYMIKEVQGVLLQEGTQRLFEPQQRSLINE
jgi:hypothetical protein